MLPLPGLARRAKYNEDAGRECRVAGRLCPPGLVIFSLPDAAVVRKTGRTALFQRLERNPRRQHNQRGPQHVGAKQMDNLQPDRRQKHYIENSQHILTGKKNEHQSGQAAVVPVRPVLRRAHQQPDEKDAGQDRNDGMRPAPAHQPAAGGRKVLRKRGPSELAGKSVSPSAASEPVTPTINTTRSDAMAPNGATRRTLPRK